MCFLLFLEKVFSEFFFSYFGFVYIRNELKLLPALTFEDGIKVGNFLCGMFVKLQT